MQQSTTNRSRSEPVNVVAAYMQQKCIELARELRPRSKVYLDTKFWLMLRDSRLNRSPCADTKQLLQVLETAVADGQIICPFNADIYFELQKQSDNHTLMATAQLIDDLSLGVCLAPLMQRIEIEIWHFIESSLRGTDAIHALDDLAWTKTPYTLGFVTPNCDGLSDSANIQIQRDFADHMWTLSLKEMLSIGGQNEITAKKSSFTSQSAALNAGKFAHLNDHDSFQSLFLCEIGGVLDACEQTIARVVQSIFERSTGQVVPDKDAVQTAAGHQFAKLIYNAFRLNKITNQVPTIRIGAALHAAVRWDKKRKYKDNDALDFHHAKAALAYCDFFLTEKSLRHLVADKNLRFDEYFNCVTIDTSADALKVLASKYSR